MSSTFEVDGIANSTLTEAVDEIITNFKSLKPPFICPIDRCAKPCLGLMSLKHHLLKLHKERLSQIRHSDDENTLSDGNDGFENVQTPNVAANSFSATNILANRSRKGGRRKRKSLKFTSQKNRAALRASKAGTLGATDDEFGNPEGDELQYATTSQNTSLSPTSGGQLNMTYEESLRVAMFHVQGRSYRVEIDEPLPLKFVDIPSGKSRDSSSLQASATLGSAGSSTSLTGKGSGSVKSKNRTTKGASAAKPPLKKLPEAEVKWFENPPIIGKPHVVPKLYREFKEKTAEELDRDVEYVMDDLDYAWLKMYNLEHRVQKCLPEVSTKDFELLMDRLEKDSRFETNIKGHGGGNLGSVGGDDHEEDAVCSICQDGEANNTNVILFCDMCNLPVHQECYGVPYIPEGQWVCRKCLLSPSHPVSCPLCPIKTGAFKQTSKNKWCHVSCAIWIPEVQFANAVFLEPIENLENIPAARFKLCCYICKKRNVGACVQCSKANCFTAFHIACGQSAGLHIKLEPIKHPEHSPTLVNVKKVAYCDVHTPADSDRKPLINSSGSSSSAEDSKNSKKLKQIFAQNKSQTASQVQVCLPEISPEKYEEIVGRVNFPAKVQFLTRLTSYWLLRRQALNGFPLIKRLHMTHIQKQQHNAQVALEKCENDNIGAGLDKDKHSEFKCGSDGELTVKIDDASSQSFLLPQLHNSNGAKTETLVEEENLTEEISTGLKQCAIIDEVFVCESSQPNQNESSSLLMEASCAEETVNRKLGINVSLSVGGAIQKATPCCSYSYAQVKLEQQEQDVNEKQMGGQSLNEDDDENIEWQQLSTLYDNSIISPAGPANENSSKTSASTSDSRLTRVDLELLKLQHSDVVHVLNLVVQDIRKLSEKQHSRDPLPIFSQDNSVFKRTANSNNSRMCSPEVFVDDAEIVPLDAIKTEPSESLSSDVKTETISGEDGSEGFSDVPCNGQVEWPFLANSPCNDLERRDYHLVLEPVSLKLEDDIRSAHQEYPSDVIDGEKRKKRRYYPRMKEMSAEKCAAFLNSSYDARLLNEFEDLILSLNLQSVENCCQELIKLRNLAHMKETKLYHSVAQGKVLIHLKGFTDSEKHLDNILKSRNIQLESTQRNNYSKLYRFYTKYREICSYNTSSSYVIKNFPLVKRVFEAGLVRT